MVKFNRRDKQLKDFDRILEEITQYQNCNSDDEQISADNIEYEILSESGDVSESSSSSIESDEEFTITPGQSINISGGRAFCEENSEDFPQETSEYEVQFATDQLNKLNIVDRKEYQDQKHILKPVKNQKASQKRCPNYDD